MTPPPTRPTPWLLIGAALLALASVARYAAFALPAALELDGAWDFRNCYVSARAFLDGRNPYDAEQQDFVAVRDTGLRPGQAIEWGNLIIIPPGNFVFFAPLAVLPWRIAVGVWLVLNQVALVALLVCARRLAGHALGPIGFLFGIAALFAMDPAWEAVKAGQPALVMGACTLAALVFARDGHDRAAGVALGLALLKYNLSLPVFGYFLLKRRFRAAVLAAGVAALINVVPLALGDAADMMAHAQANMEFTFSDGGINNQKNPMGSYNDVSLPVLLWRLFPGWPDFAVRGLWGLVVLGLAGLLAYGARGDGFEPLEIAALTAFCLLFVYHRVYDAPLLVAAGYGTAAAWRAGRLRSAEAAAAALLLATFLFKNRGEIWPFPLEPAYVLTWLSYRNWALLALTALLCARVARPAAAVRPAT